MSDFDGLTLISQKQGRRAIMTAYLDGTAIHTDRLDPCSAKARGCFLDAVLERAPGLADQRADAERELLRLSTDHARALGAEQEAASTEAAASQVTGLKEHAPCEEPVQGGEWLGEMLETTRRYVVLSSEHEAVTCALWCMFAATHDAHDISPILSLTSPTKGCGKSTLLSVLAGVVPRALPVSSVTSAALFRSIESFHPTIFADEVDTMLKPGVAPEDVRAVFNSGWSRAAAMVLRCVGDDHEPRPFSTWAPKLIAGIGRRPATIEDRSITIGLRRKGKGEHAEKFRYRGKAAEILDRLGSRLARWAADNTEALQGVRADVPDLGRDRLADSWEPLLVVADQCGGEWPERARVAARVLCASAPDDEDAPVMLLEDLRQAFGELRVDRLPTGQILERLVELDGRPWSEWRRGKPITAHGLGRLLKRFGIGSRTIRLPGGTPKGYVRDDFEDAWSRYLTPVPPLPKRHNATQLTLQGNPGNQNATPGSDVADLKPGKPNKNAGCGGVADPEGGVGTKKSVVVVDRTETGEI